MFIKNNLQNFFISVGGFSKRDFDDLMNDSSFEKDHLQTDGIKITRKIVKSQKSSKQNETEQKIVKQNPKRGLLTKYIYVKDKNIFYLNI